MDRSGALTQSRRDRLQRCVEKCRMQSIVLGIARLAQSDFRQRFSPAPPQAIDATERRAVLQPERARASYTFATVDGLRAPSSNVLQIEELDRR